MDKRLTPILKLFIGSLVAFASCHGSQGGKSGESPMIVFRGADGRTLTLEELKGVTGTFRYEGIGDMNVPGEARALHQQARQAGGQGNYKKALELLAQASALAPQWPYPVYDAAYTRLLMKDFDGAREDYRKTVQLSPRGFFTAITALDTLDREKKGDLPAGIYLAYLSLEWVQDPAQKTKAVRQLVEHLPQFAPGWKELAALTNDDDERLAALEKGLAANPDAETKGMLLINKALALNLRGDHDGAVRLLGEVALDPNSMLDTEHMAKASLALLVKK